MFCIISLCLNKKEIERISKLPALSAKERSKIRNNKKIIKKDGYFTDLNYIGLEKHLLGKLQKNSIY